MDFNINQLDKFKQIIIIDKDSCASEDLANASLYDKLIDILEYLNLLIVDNKLKWIGDNVCIVYNLHNLSNAKVSKIKTLFDYLKSQIVKTNSQIIFLYKNSNDIYKIGNNIILHSDIVKRILKTIDNNIFDINNLDKLYNVVNELIRVTILNTVNSLNMDINKHMEKFINKNSLHLKKQNSIHYLNKLCFVNDYRNKKSKKIYCIGEKQKKFYRIINNNQIIIM